MPATQVDKNYYSHELREFTRYRKLGWKTGVPSSVDETSTLWNNTHTATLEDYGLSGLESELYHPDAMNAAEMQMELEYLQSLKFTK